eukprot:m.6822 g.6822  ORF g.6822 m.6822 type:complete len:62 (-) comp3881_c0_seq2:103-288(-)
MDCRELSTEQRRHFVPVSCAFSPWCFRTVRRVAEVPGDINMASSILSKQATGTQQSNEKGQ